jgi:GntR family transcriptional regulator
METSYRFLANEQPVQLSRSWEPLTLTRQTPVERPEEGPVSGVVARMDQIGHHVDQVVEMVTARAATSHEIEQLELPRRGAYVLVIERAGYAGGQPLETCDITFPGDRYQLTYTITVPD